MKKKFINKSFILTIIIAVLIDQISKYLIRTQMSLGESIPLIKNVFHFTYVTNTGISFGMLKGHNFIFILISVAVLIFLLINLKEFKDSMIALAFIISGILGNLTDRIFLGSVVDFIDFRIWPIFNFADSFINIGVFLIIISMIKEEIKNKKKMKK